MEPKTTVMAPTLVLKNVHSNIRRSLFTRVIHSKLSLIANIYFKGTGQKEFMDVLYNFHTIMGAEEMLRDHPTVIINEDMYTFEWSTYSAISVLVIGFVEDFPVEELLCLLNPYALVRRMFKVREHPALVVVYTSNPADASAAQRGLHGTQFRGNPLFVGSELPGFTNLSGKAYTSITNFKPDDPNEYYEAPSLFPSLNATFALTIDMNKAYQVLALEPDPDKRRVMVQQLREYGALQVAAWNRSVHRLESRKYNTP